MKTRLKNTLGGIVILSMLLSLTASVAYASHPPRTYEVTITNLTASGQPFTPPVVVTHSKLFRLFKPGHASSFELKEIAENGNLTPMLDALAANPRVSDVVVAVAGDPPPLMPGASVTIQISAEGNARFLSFVSMLICTNDGFTGKRLRLPGHVGDSVTAYAGAYDAGTEINTEDFADIVPPCPILSGVPSDDPGSTMSDPALAENGVVHHHAGILGGVDLIPEIHGWTDPVVMITITHLP